MRYEVRSNVYQGGGVLSRHRTMSGAERFIAKQDAAIRKLNQFGGTYYHDCYIVDTAERDAEDDSRDANQD